jgi:micrococcal nuclease
LRGILARLAALPVAAKVLLAVAVLIVLGLSVVLSPFLLVLASLALVVSLIALLIQLLLRGSLRRWGIVAAASIVLVLVFSGISNALYGGGGEEQATSPEPTQETQPAQPHETTVKPETKTTDEETAASDKTREPERSQQAAENADKVKPERDAPQPASPEDKLAELGKVVALSRVVDGDTIEVSPAVGSIADVRLIGMDTPETYGGAEPYGKRASAFTTQHLEGRQVALEFDVERIDPYGRVLAYV